MNMQSRDLLHAILFSCLASSVFSENAEKPTPPVDAAKVDEAVSRGAEWLLSQVTAGLPPIEDAKLEIYAGQTYNEIVLYALLSAGIPKGDPGVLKLVRDTRATPLSHTYGAAIRAQAFERFDAIKLGADIAQCAQFIVDNQGKNGYWGYGTPIQLPPLPRLDLTPPKADPPGAAAPKPAGSRGRRMVINRRGWGQFNDNSNTQYAVLGLAACMAAGIYPPDDTIPLVEKWLIDCQNDNGGWGYETRNTPMHDTEASYGSMTAGGLAALSCCIRSRKQNPLKHSRVQKALDWLGHNLTFDKNPGALRYTYYWIYAVERAGSFAGTAWFAQRPWYSEGVDYLLGQQNPDGSWANNAAGQKIPDTCWAILFLKQASRHYCE